MGYVGNTDLEIKDSDNDTLLYKLNKYTVFYDILMMAGVEKQNIKITGGEGKELYITQISYTKDGGVK